MSDTLILGLSLAAFTMVTTLITNVLNGFNARKNMRLTAELTIKLAEATAKVNKIDEKVDEQHKVTNSRLTQLLEAREKISHDAGLKIGIEQGTAEGIKHAEDLVNYNKGKEGKIIAPNKEPDEK